MDIPRLTQLPSFTYRSSFNHTCSLQYLCRSGITTRSYTAKSFHNTGRRMIRMIEYLFTCSETIPGRIFTYTIGSSHHRFQVDRCVLMRWHQRSYSNDIQDWTGCHHFLVQTYEHSLDLDSPTVITHRWLKLFLSLIRFWWKWWCQECTYVHTGSSFSVPILTCTVPKSNSQWYNIPLHSLETTSLTSDESKHSYAWRITTREQSCQRLKAPMLSKLGGGALVLRWMKVEWWNHAQQAPRRCGTYHRLRRSDSEY